MWIKRDGGSDHGQTLHAGRAMRRAIDAQRHGGGCESLRNAGRREDGCPQ